MSGHVSGYEDAALALLASQYGQSEGVLTASGAASVEVALRRLGVGLGDEVILPDIGCYKIGAAVLREGAAPVFAAVGQALVLGPASIDAALGPRTRCVIVVHQYGLPCPVAAIREVLPDRVGIVEDVAQAWGTVGDGRPAGRGGDLVVTSFGPNKPVPVGAGGALLGDDPRLAELVASDRPDHRMLDVPPTSAPFPAPLLSQLVLRLEQADALTERRREFVQRLGPLFSNSGFRLPDLGPGDQASWHRVPVWCATKQDRGRLLAAARRVGLHARPDHHVPLVELPMFRGRLRVRDAPGAEADTRDRQSHLVVLSADCEAEQARHLVGMLARYRSSAVTGGTA